MVLHDDMHARATKAATAIQFHDRLVQCLTHVSASLTYGRIRLPAARKIGGGLGQASRTNSRAHEHGRRACAVRSVERGCGINGRQNTADRDECGKVELFDGMGRTYTL